MPFTGGFSPSPERTGGGDAGSAIPRLQRIFESIAARRGKAFDPTDESIVGAENMAYARAIESDLFGANERFANEMNPVNSTVGGLLPRWEKIFGVPPVPGDTQSARQARVATAAAKSAATNDMTGIAAAISPVLGALFSQLVLITPAQANTWWPGLGGTTAKITGVSGNLVTVAFLANVPTDAPGKQITLSNVATPGNAGTYPIQSRVSASSLVLVNNGSPATDNGVGGSSGAPTIHWSLTNQLSPWTSTIARILVEVNPLAVPGYTNPDGTLNGAFFQAVNAINPILDWLLPADHTFDWFVESSHGAIGFYLDEPNLDLEAFDS